MGIITDIIAGHTDSFRLSRIMQTAKPSLPNLPDWIYTCKREVQFYITPILEYCCTALLICYNTIEYNRIQ